MLSITLSSDFADSFLRNFADTYLLYKIVSICSSITNVPHGDNTYALFHKKINKHYILYDHEICFYCLLIHIKKSTFAYSAST